MTTAQVVETSVTVNSNSPIQDYVHQGDQTQPFEKGSSENMKMITSFFSDLSTPLWAVIRSLLKLGSSKAQTNITITGK